MSHEVFCLRELKHKLSCKIDSIATARNLFFLGTSDGKVMVYEVSLQNRDAQCVYIHNSKHKLPIRMIIPIVEKGILLVLAGDVIAVHQLNHMTHAPLDSLPEDRLPEMNTVKGSKDIVTLHVKRQRGIFSMAVLQRKKITLYEYRDHLREFVMVNDGFLLPDGAKTLLWVGKNIILGFRREYVIMNVLSGATDYLYPTGKSGIPLLLSLDPVPEVLVGDENKGMRALHDGSLVPGKSGMSWSSIPTNATYIHPFLLTVHDNNCMEVRLPFFTAHAEASDLSPWQTLSLKGADRISQRPFADFDASLPKEATPSDALRKDISILVSSNNTVYLLELLPVREQVLALASLNCVEAGLILCQLCANEVDQATVDSLKTQSALWSFHAKKDFKTAMLRFRDANVDPRLVIDLFPGFLTKRARETWHPPKEYTRSLDTTDLAMDMRSAITAFLDYALPLRREYATEEKTVLAEAIDTAIMKAYVVMGQEQQLLSFLAEENFCSLAESEVFLVDSEQWVALITLWYFYKQNHKSLVLLYTLGTTRERVLLESLLTTSFSPGNLPFDMEFLHILHLLLANSLGKSSSNRVLSDRRDRRANFIPQSEMMRILDEIAVNADPSHQLGFLRRCVSVVTTITYISLLSWDEQEERALAEQYSRWILANVSPRWSVKMFPVTEIQPKHYTTVLRLLSSDMSDMGDTEPHERRAEWLSLVFDNTCNVKIDASIHDAYFQSLVQLLLSTFSQEGDGDNNEEKKERSRVSELHQRLENFLRLSEHIDISNARNLLEQPDLRSRMYAERAIIYRRLELHEEAICMFLYEAKELQAAQEYAKHVGHDGQDAFQVLLRLLLHPSDGCTSPRLDDAIEMLNTCEGVNLLTALPMLPDDTPVLPIAGFIKRSIRDASTRSRSAAMNASILEARIRQAELKLALERSRQVVMDLGTCCAVCEKKLRPDVVFARFPNGVVVHQACMEDEHICPITYKDFRLGIEPFARGAL
ncbi:hypothetical protein ECC02_002486 [Trypanosoma cruzi]|uniref:CNH domain-containing protein n=1 Tax=Trypanosoma cruzi TaxID=5693 RepID=A0A7J6YDJ2_TRYCR|nr:hypothetical protein ECC02_002486 [Trypanosoma cruzi]